MCAETSIEARACDTLAATGVLRKRTHRLEKSDDQERCDGSNRRGRAVVWSAAAAGCQWFERGREILQLLTGNEQESIERSDPISATRGQNTSWATISATTNVAPRRKELRSP